MTKPMYTRYGAEGCTCYFSYVPIGWREQADCPFHGFAGFTGTGYTGEAKVTKAQTPGQQILNAVKDLDPPINVGGAGVINPPPPPEHYAAPDGEGPDPWAYIEAHGLDYWAGNVIKYVTRAGRKDTATVEEDLIKARTTTSTT